MKIRIKKAFSLYKPGQVFDWGRGMCRLLIARGLIEEVSEPVVEAAVAEPAVEAAAETRKPARRKK